MSVFTVIANTAFQGKKIQLLSTTYFGCFWHILAVFGYHNLDVTIYIGRNTSSS
jgi:hypothetical protein